MWRGLRPNASWTRECEPLWGPRSTCPPLVPAIRFRPPRQAISACQPRDVASGPTDARLQWLPLKMPPEIEETRALVGSDHEVPAGPRLVGESWSDADSHLLGLAQRHGAGLAAAVYDRFGDEVNRLVWRLLGPDTEHDDVVHDALVQVLSGLASVRDPLALRRWVMSVTVNTVRGHIRRRRLHRVFHQHDQVAVEEALSPDVDHDGRELVRRTFSLMSKLPGDQRVAFVLRYIERRSLEETASLCGCSLATVKRRLRSADTRLRKMAARDPMLAPRLPEGRRRRQRVVD